MSRLRARSLLLACGLVLGANGLQAQFGFFDSGTPRVVFFPPTTPIYGSAIEGSTRNRVRSWGGRSLTAPDGLADFVGEAFYPALGTRLAVPELAARLETRLQLYRTQRDEQVNALLNQLVVLRDAPAATREQELRSFAEIQTPQLVSLEAEAERLREDIINDGLFTNADWNAGRRWRLGSITSKGDGVETEAEFQVVRATAFYQSGLVAAQRGLLRELAHELQLAARKARGLPAARAESDAMFFSPETTRFRLPPNLSAATRTKIGIYNGQKAALKLELRETIVAQEGIAATRRARAFEALAEKQWPQLKTLEETADEIRGLLVSRLEAVLPPAPPWIPAGLLENIQTYNADRDAFFSDLKKRVDYILDAIPKPPPYLAADERLQQQRDYALQREQVRKQVTRDFQEANRERFAELARRYEEIREMLTVVADKQKDRQTGRPLTADTLLRQHALSMEEFALFGREETIYTNYRIAMFQPGLYAEQRRLLFGYALTALAQPLPGGEIMPYKSATRPSPSS